jgi:hypothetical protein
MHVDAKSHSAVLRQIAIASDPGTGEIVILFQHTTANMSAPFPTTPVKRVNTETPHETRNKLEQIRTR